MLHRGPTSTAIASCSPRCSGTVSLRAESWHGVGRRVRPCRAAELADSLSAVVDHLPLALTPVGTPCAIAKCGDMVYRSTLDPNLYKQGGFDWRGALLLASVAGYLFLPPGVLPGFLDTYVLAPYLRARSKAVDKTDIALGKKLGTGGFGTVYKADLKENGEKVPIIVKKAKEFGEAEVWMNERLSRAPGNHVAKFITAFDDTAKPSNYSTPFDNAIWLLWYYEGDSTLAGLMEKKDFPYNMEEVLFGRELRLPKNELRKAATIKLAFKQLLEAVGACHNTGIVHRDIKPQNCILSTRDRKLKLIDLGAAADLRVGINYVPNEYLMDPRYAPPQQYIMSTQTPKPPPAPVAAFLSPVLWAMETPDRFDMFSCGMTLMQLVFPPLRSDNAILDFRAALQELDWDLDAWRRQKEAKLAAGALKPAVVAEWEEGFAILDADGGWELLRGLMTYKPSQRWSAARALAHPWITGNVVASQALGVAAAGSAALASAGQALSDLVGSDLVDEAITRSKSGAFTESQLLQELGLEDKAPKAPQASQTIAWWQERQAEFKRRAADKQAAAGTDGAKGAAAAATAAANSNGNGSSSKLKVPVILNVGAKKADSSAERAANGNANAKAPANANGKAPANNVKAPAAGKNGKAAPSAGAANSAPKKVFDLKGLFKRN